MLDKILYLSAMLLLAMLAAPLGLLAFVGLWIACRFLKGLVLSLLARVFWCRRGRYVLFVYSDSPVWKEYMEQRMLPRLGTRAVVLNWSHRRRWRPTLAVRVFLHYGGCREFNPMAIVFGPGWRVREFRFYLPFRDYKHGRTETLAKLEAEMYEALDEASGRLRAHSAQ